MAKPNRVARNTFYVGFEQQVSKGTGVTPIYFPQYFDGDISINPERDFESYTPAGGQFANLSLLQKFSQPGALSVLGTPQVTAMLASYLMGKEQILGTQPEPANASSLDGAVAAEATDISVVIGEGSNFTAGEYIQLVAVSDTAEATGEIRVIDSILIDTITLTTALSYAHSAGDVVEEVTAPFLHKAMFETRADMPWFSTEISSGYDADQTDPIIARLIDCRMASLELSCESGMPLMLAAALKAINNEKMATETEESFESNNPFQFFQGTYTVDSGVTTNITNFNLSLANRLDEDDYTNAITAADIPLLGREGQLTWTLKLDDGSRFWDTFLESGHDAVLESLYEGDFNVAFTYGTDTAIRNCTIDIPLLDHVEATVNPGSGDGTLEYACSANLKKQAGSEFMTITTGDDQPNKYVV